MAKKDKKNDVLVNDAIDNIVEFADVVTVIGRDTFNDGKFAVVVVSLSNGMHQASIEDRKTGEFLCAVLGKSYWSVYRSAKTLARNTSAAIAESAKNNAASDSEEQLEIPF